MEKEAHNDKIQGQGHACHAGHDAEGISGADGYQTAHGVRNLHRAVQHLPVEALDKICDVLDCQPADLMEFVKDAE